jgi:hypothetical protein
VHHGSRPSVRGRTGATSKTDQLPYPIQSVDFASCQQEQLVVPAWTSVMAVAEIDCFVEIVSAEHSTAVDVAD